MLSKGLVSGFLSGSSCEGGGGGGEFFFSRGRLFELLDEAADFFWFCFCFCFFFFSSV